MSEITLSDVIKSHIDAFSNGLYTALPCKITSVKDLSSNQTIDCQPSVRRLLTTNQVYTLPTLYSVPVVFPSGGGGSLTFPLKAGDTVLVVFSMRSIDEWLDGSGQVVTPIHRRKHNISDGFAIPCAHTLSNNVSPSSTDVVTKFKDMTISLKESGDLELSKGGSSITLADNGDININASGDVNVTGTTINLN